MRYSVAIVAAALTAAASATDFQVEVAPNAKLIYSPNSLTAMPGDTVTFRFNPKNHTVTQSDFQHPCVPLSTGGFSSGFVPTAIPDFAEFTITVKDTKPIWFYCAQNNPVPHCKAGMVGAVNAPPSGNTLTAFAALAAKTNSSIAVPGGPVGGTFMFLNTTTGSSTGTMTASAPGSTGSGSSPLHTGAASAVGVDVAGAVVGAVGAVAYALL